MITKDNITEILLSEPFIERVVNSTKDYFAMNNEIQFILYQLPDEEGRVQVVIKDETIWATQKAMAQLFGVGVPAISKHLAHIFEEGELDKDVAISKMGTTTLHGAINEQDDYEKNRNYWKCLKA